MSEINIKREEWINAAQLVADRVQFLRDMGKFSELDEMTRQQLDEVIANYDQKCTAYFTERPLS